MKVKPANRKGMLSRPTPSSEPAADRDLRSEGVDGAVRELRLGKPGVGEVGVIDPDAGEPILIDIVAGTAADTEGEVEILTEAMGPARVGVGRGIGEAETDQPLDVGNDLPAGLDEVVAGADVDADDPGLDPVGNRVAVALEEELGVTAQEAPEDVVERDVVDLQGGGELGGDEGVVVELGLADIGELDTGAEFEGPIAIVGGGGVLVDRQLLGNRRGGGVIARMERGTL